MKALVEEHGFSERRACQAAGISRSVARYRQARPLTVGEGINASWSADFMSGTLWDGRRFRTFNVVDDSSREGLAIEIDLNLPAARVIRVLDLYVFHTLPKPLIMGGPDQGDLTVLEPWLEDGSTAAQMAIAYFALGHIEDADAIAASLRQATSSQAAGGLAEYCAVRGEFDKAFAWMAEWRRRMEDIGLPGMHDRWRQYVHSSAFLRPLRDDPRWAAMLAE